MKMVYRTVKSVLVHYVYYNATNGKIEHLECLLPCRNGDKKGIERALNGCLGAKCKLLDYEVKEEWTARYALPLEDFISEATLVDKKANVL